LELEEQRSKVVRQLSIQRGQDIGPEEPRFIVLLVKGDPGDPRMVRGQRLAPHRKQRGLAKTSRSRDEDEGVLQTLIEQGRQTRTRDERAECDGHRELGDQKLIL